MLCCLNNTKLGPKNRIENSTLRFGRPLNLYNTVLSEKKICSFKRLRTYNQNQVDINAEKRRVYSSNINFIMQSWFIYIFKN